MNFNFNRSASTANRPPDPPDFTNFLPLATNSQTFNNINKTHFNQNQIPTTGNMLYKGALGGRAQGYEKNKIELQPRKHEILKGKPVITFTKEEHNMLAKTCRWTLIGKFKRSRPQNRADYAKIVPTKGHVKIGAKDSKHVFIDVGNEEDYSTIVSFNFIQLGEDNNTAIQIWTTDFNPNASSTLAPVWINLPDLPWHYYRRAALCRIVEPIGNLIILDSYPVQDSTNHGQTQCGNRSFETSAHQYSSGHKVF